MIIRLLTSLFAVALLTAIDASAKTIKLHCRNALPGGSYSDAGPMEVDLPNRVIYRYTTRRRCEVTSITETYVTCMETFDVGGEIAVFEKATGKLSAAFVREVRGEVLAKELTPLECSRSLLDE